VLERERTPIRFQQADSSVETRYDILSMQLRVLSRPSYYNYNVKVGLSISEKIHKRKANELRICSAFYKRQLTGAEVSLRDHLLLSKCANFTEQVSMAYYS
jgi:hypothetical protein